MNTAKIALGILARQCIDRRLPDQETLKREINAWQNARNQKAIRVDWQCTTEAARVKLTSLYPSI